MANRINKIISTKANTLYAMKNLIKKASIEEMYILRVEDFWRNKNQVCTEIMEKFDGIDLDAAGKVAGNGFYYLMGDIARLHSAVISYARDFMIDRGFTYCIPPFMIRSNVVTGVMSFAEMDAMMYKIEGEDL